MKDKKKAGSFIFDGIKVGMRFGFRRRISKRDIKTFARLTGDFSPIHVDERYAKEAGFGHTIAHGMLTASLISTLVGMRCPGRNSLIIGQEINYIRPVTPGTEVRIVGEVVRKSEAVRMVFIKAEIFDEDGNLIIDSMTKVKVTR